MGYYAIGMDIDPSDWARPGVQAIVSSVLSQARAGAGSVVLLHDGGGNRSETVAALPAIIIGLRALGFRLVTVSALMGVPASAVNPRVPGCAFISATGLGFGVLGGFGDLIATLFIVGLTLGIGWLLLLVVLALAGWRRSRRRRFPAGFQPPAAVIVPAYNEETVIAATLAALRASDYPLLEIIVVDDGSSDATFECASWAAAGDPRVRVLRKDNGGKASALNWGIARTEAEVIVAQDADTLLAPDAVALLVRHFAEERVAAVAGNAKVGNRLNLLTKWQALEYITSQNLERRAFARLNCITVVPGAVGAWRRRAVLAAGGFASDTLAEDADLTLTLLEQGHRVAYEQRAVGLTEAPDRIAPFVRQRFRWVYGTMQALFKHRGGVLHPRRSTAGIVAIPQAAVFKVLFPVLLPLMDLTALASIGLLIVRRFERPGDWNEGLLRLLVFCGLFLAADYLAAAVALMLEGDEQWGLLPWLGLQRFFYRQLLSYVAIKSLLSAVRGKIVPWGKLKREGSVTAAFERRHDPARAASRPNTS
jgi:cellulose synthase/poly-beta-1,6-N-acetylglucosamine synthase-like glycosyltransferase